MYHVVIKPRYALWHSLQELLVLWALSSPMPLAYHDSMRCDAMVE